jgi:hypothetical protein
MFEELSNAELHLVPDWVVEGAGAAHSQRGVDAVIAVIQSEAQDRPDLP